MAIAVTLLLLLASMTAQAGSSIPVVLYACDKSTCTYTVDEKFDQPFVTESIFAIADSEPCPGKCTNVHVPSMDVHAVGNLLDLSCRVWGGNFCKWGGDALSPDDTFKIMRQR